jgi:predicted MFS family arabinose efflux permease
MFPDRQRDRTIANFGLSFAIVPLLGVPLGAWLGELFGSLGFSVISK